MADIAFNIVELTRQVFGLGAISISGSSLPRSIEYDGIETINLEGNYPKSRLLGNPVLDTVLFKQNINGEPFEYFLDRAPVISVNQPSHIVYSRVRRRRGNVKEIINLGDYVGKIEGIIANVDSNDPPYEEMAEMDKLKSTQPWEVESDLFAALEIFYLVIKDVKFPAYRGMGNSQPYVIEFISDEPIVLEI